MADLKTNLLGFVMNSPVIGASGTVGYGVEYEELADFSKIGGISGKGLTLHGQYGNKGERLWETPSGLINSIGLQNPGVQHFIDVELPEMLELKQKYGTVAIANLGGHSEEEYVEGAAMLSESAVDIVELNISCPNVKVGGMAYGVKAEAAGEVVRMVRDACKKPLMVKLSPQAENIPAMCKAVEAAGADAISLTNTFQACAIDLEKRRPVFDNIFAGLSGPAAFDISRAAAQTGKGKVYIDLSGNEDIEAKLRARIKANPSLCADDALTGVLHNRLGRMVVKYAGVPGQTPLERLEQQQIAAIAAACRDFCIELRGVEDFDHAQVTAGGIKTTGVNPETLESWFVPHLFITGELLDVDADCGGYNLQWAWASGVTAGRLGK